MPVRISIPYKNCVNRSKLHDSEFCIGSRAKLDAGNREEVARHSLSKYYLLSNEKAETYIPEDF